MAKLQATSLPQPSNTKSNLHHYQAIEPPSYLYPRCRTVRQCMALLSINDQLLISCSFNRTVLVDTTPLPDSIPPVREIGSSSAPLLSAAYFIGARCRPFNDDYMQCKTEAYGKGETECMKEGRKVTRCAASVWVDSSKYWLAFQGYQLISLNL